SLGSFSSRCPRGFDCDKIKMSSNQSHIACDHTINSVWLHILNLYVYKYALWYKGRNKWEELKGDLECDSKLGSWVGRRMLKNRTSREEIILSEQLICGKSQFKLGSVYIEQDYL
ncbi:hypothetical protein PMAYCL1PPCAC_13065, partial [Pristionchus mayeri]